MRPGRAAILVALLGVLGSPGCRGDGPTAPALVITSLALPEGAITVPYAQQLTATGGGSSRRWSVLSGALPPGLSLSVAGLLAGTPNTTGSYAFEVRVTSSGRRRTRALTLDVVQPLTVTTATLGSAVVGDAFSAVLGATGGIGGYAWSVSAGALPAGLSLSAAGTLNGTPTAAGSATFTVSVVSGAQVAAREFTIAVAPALAILTERLRDGIVGAPYADTVRAEGVVGTPTWSVLSGAPPAGLTLLANGELSGTPTTPDSSAFTVQVTSGSRSVARTHYVAVSAVLTLETVTLPNATAGVPYSQALVVSGGTGTFAFSVVDGALPAGLTLAPYGVLEGTPTTPSVHEFTVRVVSATQVVEREYTVQVSPPEVARVVLAPLTPQVELGDTVRLSATAYDAGDVVLPGRPIAWSSLNGAVVSVDGSGLVTGVTLGAAGVVATASGAGGTPVSDTVIVSVVPVPVDSVEVVPGTVSLLIGEVQPLGTVLRDRADNVLTGRTVTWTSSAPVVASVDPNTGVVTSGAEGEATITALSEGIAGTATVLVSRGMILTQVSGGDRHTCGLTEAQLVFCWGRNTEGQLGDTTLVDQLNPVRVLLAPAFVSVRTGYLHTCALTASGAAYCWGNNGTGRLGDGTTDRRLSPTAVSGGISFTSIAPGGTHTCGLTAAGAAYCWGLNLSGQLGDNSVSSKSVPTLVAGGLTFASLTAGGNHTCGLTTGGAAYCWGLNSLGQLGDGTSGAGTNRIVPTAVTGGLTFTRLSAASAHTCGIATDGNAYCWGSNGSNPATAGRLGDGTTDPQRITPTVVAGGVTFTDIAAGGVHTCARTAAGLVYCWGANDNGAVGDGTFTSRTSPVPVDGGFTWDAFGVGNFHACAIRDAGRTFCWGQNTQGAVGDGTVAVRAAPVGVRP